MNNVIITKGITKEEAVNGNGVFMVGKILNKNQVMRKEAIKTNGVIMVGRIPNKREMETTSNTVIDMPIADTTDGLVEIPAFLIKAQEERRLAKANQQRRANKKKTSSRKPSLIRSIVNNIKSL